MSVTLNRLVVVGQAVPESREGSGTLDLCNIGYDRDLRTWVRIWPVPATGDRQWRRWATYSVDLERDPTDTREESWRPVEIRPMVTDEPGKKQAKSAIITEATQSSALSVEWLNDERKSVGLCRSITVPSVEVVVNDAPVGEHGVRARELRPYLNWKDESGDEHRQTLLDWGSWRLVDSLLADGITDPRRVASELQRALYLHLTDREFYVLTGNQASHRTSYLAISVFAWDAAIAAPSWRKTGSAPRPVIDMPRLFYGRVA